MYIDVKDLLIAIIYIIAIGALIYFIIVLNNLVKLIKRLTNIVDRNEENINKLCDSLPDVSENILTISDNVKDISEVATEVTADAIVAKENLLGNYETIKDIINIILSIFSNKK